MKDLVALIAAVGFAVSSTVAFAQDCEEGTTWDETTETCVPNES